MSPNASTARHGSIRLIVLAGLVLAAIIAIWGIVRFRSRTPQPDASREIAASFLDRIRSGETDAAWEGTTAEFKSFMGKERLRQFVQAHPTLSLPAESTGFQVLDRQGLALSECTFRTMEKPSTIRVVLAREDRQWKVERLEVE